MCGQAVQLLPFVVYLLQRQEVGFSKEHTAFECSAVDGNDAESQARAAHPDCHVVFSYQDVGLPEVVDLEHA